MTFSRYPHRYLASLVFPALLLLCAERPCAAPHGGEIQAMSQPDGGQVDVRVFGDEFYVRVEGLDGFTLARDPGTGYICYARLNADSTVLVSTGEVYRGRQGQDGQDGQGGQGGQDGQGGTQPFVAALAGLPGSLDIKREARRALRARTAAELGLDLPSPALGKLAAQPPVAPAAPDSVRKVVGLFLLVEFPDARATFTRTELEELGNKPGFNRFSNVGSIRDYFLDVSHGKLDYSLLVTEYYLAKNNKSYYDRSGGYAGGQELIKEALAGLEAKGFDYSVLTTTGTNKSVVAMNVLYAGANGKTWGQGIWPHRGSVSAVTYDGVRLSGYEMTSIGTSSLSIGTIVHENGHLLFGWPDLYDYDSDSRGVGSFCVMSGQNGKNPQPPNPYFRSTQGWDTLVDMRTLTNGLVTVPANWSKAYKYANPANSAEMFVIENVLRKGRWTTVPDEGLAIWHIDTKGNNSWQDMTLARHFRVSIEQADGKFDLEMNRNGGGANDLFHTGNKDAFGAVTLPDSKWWDGSVSGLEINNIGVTGDVMTFRIAGMPVALGRPAAGSGPWDLSLSGRALRVDVREAGPLEVAAAAPDGRSFRLASRPFAAGTHRLDLDGLPRGAYVFSLRQGKRAKSLRQTVLD